MKRKSFIQIMLMVSCLLTACTAQYETEDIGITTKQVDLSELKNNQPVLMDFEKTFTVEVDKVNAFPDLDKYDYDLRWLDLSTLDLSDRTSELLLSSFDDTTVWPQKLPQGFNYETILEQGKNPGFGINKLHERGINGEGVSIAIIDQNLVEHKEYKDNLMLYEVYKGISGEAQMHGPAVASIAVGQSTGVAPKANLYFISTWFASEDENGEYIEDLNPMVDSIERIIEINKHLPEDKKIKVLSISRDYEETDKEYDKIQASIEKAKKEGIFVITVSTEENYPFSLSGLGRNPLVSADDINSYGPGLFWEDDFYSDEYIFDENTLFVPMDSRTCASPNVENGYVYYKNGGMSWACPWLAGMYALCVQVKNDITPDEFISLAMKTGDTLEVEHEGKKYKLQKIINPEKLIAELTK